MGFLYAAHEDAMVRALAEAWLDGDEVARFALLDRLEELS